MLIAADQDNLLLISGTGDVIQPTDGVAAIGSGGAYALAAARALLAHSDLTPAQIVRTSLEIAGRPVHLHQSQHRGGRIVTSSRQ